MENFIQFLECKVKNQKITNKENTIRKLTIYHTHDLKAANPRRAKTNPERGRRTSGRGVGRREIVGAEEPALTLTAPPPSAGCIPVSGASVPELCPARLAVNTTDPTPALPSVKPRKRQGPVQRDNKYISLASGSNCADWLWEDASACRPPHRFQKDFSGLYHLHQVWREKETPSQTPHIKNPGTYLLTLSDYQFPRANYHNSVWIKMVE